MTPRWEVTQIGQSEKFKCGIHLAMLGLATTCAFYNAAVCQQRPCWRSAFSTALYFGIAVFEAKQALRHMDHDA